MKLVPYFFTLVCLVVWQFQIATSRSAVVINEVLHDSEPNLRCDEFIELHNSGPGAVDISDWHFTNGIDFTFPTGTIVSENAYIVVAQDPASISSLYGFSALGPWVGGLSNEGETIALRDSGGNLIDEVTYKGSFPWPVGATGTGRSMELINPALDNDLGGSWRAAGAILDDTESVTFLAPALTGWHYRKGTSEASNPVDDWRSENFVEDATWLTGQTPIGYGDNDDATLLNDMQNSYSSVYLRKEFIVPVGEVPSQLIVRVYIDDGAMVWINGTEVARFSVGGGELSFNDTAISHEAAWEQMTVSNAANFLNEGVNVVAIHALNQAVGSSDFSVDLNLKTPEPGAATPTPTPGARNSTYAVNAPPLVRQVNHVPKKPSTMETTVITAKVTDPNGVAEVRLEYQIVLPGAYIPALLAKPQTTLLTDPNGPRTPNPAYENPANWTNVTMVDNGTNGDTIAGDDIFSMTIPSQANRTLVRYRIMVEDTIGASVRVPYLDDPSLNFAFYVYNGTPDFVANTRSVTGQVPYTHPQQVLNSLPVYAMLTTQADFDQCVAYSGNQIPASNDDARSAFNWGATFVYDGEVYDNVAYRLRQRNARYSGTGKRSFRFRFNDGSYIQLHDNNGDPYPTKWRNLNTHKMTGSLGGANFGLYESANSALWNLTGSPAPLTHWFHFRLVKSVDEQPSGTNGQHLGDFYGLLLAIEDYDVRFLETHNLERGNLYKLKTGGNDGLSVQRYQAKGAVDDASDFTTIINELRNTQSDQWLRDHVNWESYYKYKVVVDAVRHYDMSGGIVPNNGEHLKNRSYYFQSDPMNPLGKLNLLPWDSDTSWGPNFNGGWDWPKSAMDSRDTFNMEYKNVVREFRDLVWQEDQINPLLDSFQEKLEAFQLADRDRWTGATGSPNPGSQSDGAISARVADMKRYAFNGGSWAGGSSTNRDFIYNASGVIVASDTISRDDGLSGAQGRDAYLDALAFDPAIPDKPTITYTGDANFPVNGLSFQASAYSDPQGAGTFSAIEWRIAETKPVGGAAANLIQAGSDWAYLDNGTDQGAAWRDLSFDDSAWATNPAPLGYGGINGLPEGVATNISYGTDAAQKYTTTYFRRKLQIADLGQFNLFRFKIHADDGVLVFVNGVEVVRDGFNAETTVNFNTLSDFSGNEGVFDEFEIAPGFFVEGTNLIAVELHQRTSNSNDLVFDLALEATLSANPSQIFEWNASWESGELSNQQTLIDVPTLAARDGKLYRARVRYKDNTERWSHWSDPLTFTTTLPDVQQLLDNLVISEIMYHPQQPNAAEIGEGYPDQDEFEYLELLNVSETKTLLLTDVRFTKGIDFDFASGTMLAPGGYVLVVRNQAAFEFRYGTGLPIAGEYQGNAEANLSNGGERLKLSFGAGTALRDFDYDDSDLWPMAADGNGSSLVLISPSTVPDHSLPQSWAASVASSGSPGVAEPLGNTFASFLSGFGIVDTNPDLDSDKDGLSNFLEFALGGNPIVASAAERPYGGIVEVGGGDYLTITFSRPAGTIDVTYEVEFSSDLNGWNVNGVMVNSGPGMAGKVIEVWRSATSITNTETAFGRVRVGQ